MTEAAISKEAIIKFLRDNNAPEIASLVEATVGKGSPGVADVHVASASGDQPGKKKARTFRAIMDDGSKPTVGAEKRDIEWEAAIDVQKALPDQQMIFGWASISKLDGEIVTDKQDDRIEVADLEKAAYDFTLHSRRHGDMHNKIDTGQLIESIMFTQEKAALGLVAKNEKGQTIYGWWTGFYISDENLWKDHRAGRRPELSIGGRATVIQVEAE